MLVLKACYKLVLGNGLSMPYKISFQSIRCSMCSTAFHVSTCWPPDILGFQIIMHNVYLKNCMFRPLRFIVELQITMFLDLVVGKDQSSPRMMQNRFWILFRRPLQIDNWTEYSRIGLFWCTVSELRTGYIYTHVRNLYIYNFIYHYI